MSESPLPISQSSFEICFIFLLWSSLIAPSQPGAESTVLYKLREGDQSSHTLLSPYEGCFPPRGKGNDLRATSKGMSITAHTNPFSGAAKDVISCPRLVDLHSGSGWAITDRNKQVFLLWFQQVLHWRNKFQAEILPLVGHWCATPTYSIWQSAQEKWLCPLPSSCVPPAFLLAGHEELKNPWLSQNTTLQQPKTSMCYLHSSHTKSET